MNSIDEILRCGKKPKRKKKIFPEIIELNEIIMKVNIFKKSLKQINAVLRNKISSAKKLLHKLF